MGDEPVQSLWVKIREQNKVVYVAVGVYYRPPDQEEGDEAVFRQWEKASCLQILVLVEDLTAPIYAGKTTQETIDPQDLWIALMRTS